MKGYQRIDHYNIEYIEQNETISDAINRSKTESKLFNLFSKGYVNIRNLEEAGFCLLFFSSTSEHDIRNRIMDELLSGKGVHSSYMQYIYEFYIWRKLPKEQKAICKAQFPYWRGEKEKSPSVSMLFELIEKVIEQGRHYGTE